MCSFHATKLFHTIEGGCVITKDKKINNKLDLMKRFGHNQDEHFMLGINAKASEFQAAMGLCNLKYIKKIIAERKKISGWYDSYFGNKVLKLKVDKNTKYNYAYYPVVLNNENQILKIISVLNENNIYPRRYFYPSLNNLPYLKKRVSCPVSEDISSRILCVPLYVGLERKVVEKICKIFKSNYVI